MSICIDISERSQKIADMRKQGKTFREIGEVFGFSTERARQLYKEYLATEKFNQSIMSAPNTDVVKCLYFAQQDLHFDTRLATRTYKCLLRSGYFRNGYDDTSMFNLSDDQLLKIRNFGVKSLILLRKAQDIYYENTV